MIYNRHSKSTIFIKHMGMNKKCRSPFDISNYGDELAERLTQILIPQSQIWRLEWQEASQSSLINPVIGLSLRRRPTKIPPKRYRLPNAFGPRKFWLYLLQESDTTPLRSWQFRRGLGLVRQINHDFQLALMLVLGSRWDWDWQDSRFGLLIPSCQPRVNGWWGWYRRGAVIIHPCSSFSRRNRDSVTVIAVRLRLFSRPVTIDWRTMGKGRRSASLSPMVYDHLWGVYRVDVGISCALVWHD